MQPNGGPQGRMGLPPAGGSVSRRPTRLVLPRSLTLALALAAGAARPPGAVSQSLSGLCTRPRGRGTLALAGQAWRATPALSSSANGTASGGVAARAAPAARARASVSGRASTRRVGRLLTLPPAGGKRIRPCRPPLRLHRVVSP